jgi:hypothetical protein
MQTYIYIYIYIYIYTHTHTRAQTNMQTYIHAYIHTYITQTQADPSSLFHVAHTCIHTHIHLHKHTRTSTYSEASRSFFSLSCGKWTACAIEHKQHHDNNSESESESYGTKSESESESYSTNKKGTSSAVHGTSIVGEQRRRSGRVTCWGDADMVESMPQGLVAKQVYVLENFGLLVGRTNIVEYMPAGLVVK